MGYRRAQYEPQGIFFLEASTETEENKRSRARLAQFSLLFFFFGSTETEETRRCRWSYCCAGGGGGGGEGGGEGGGGGGGEGTEV